MITVSGFNDGSSASTVTLGGPLHRYRNDFQLNGNTSTGTSRFFSGSSQVASGAITTTNFYDDNFDFIHASSTLVVDQGFTITRKGTRIGPITVNPGNPDDPADDISTFEVEFEFSGGGNPNGNQSQSAFSRGLANFTTTGNVTMAVTENGRSVALLAESSPSSLATDITIPTNADFLIFEYKWLGPFISQEIADLQIDFTADFQSTVLATLASDSSSRETDAGLDFAVIPIPTVLRGAKGVLRFSLKPSEFDGVSSKVQLAGFSISNSVPDTTPPNTTAGVSPTPNAAGWNKTNASIMISSDDVGPSGVSQIHVSSSGAQVTADQVISGNSASFQIVKEGTTVVSYYAVDDAGNVETPKTITVRIDKTAPILAGLPKSPCLLSPPNHRLVKVATVTATDGLSGIQDFQARASSNEPANGTGDGDSSPDIVIVGGEITLRAERAGTGKGRIYSLLISATDNAGNVSSVAPACTVPK